MTDTVETISQIFLRSCQTLSKPDLFLAKREGVYVPISTAEFETQVRKLAAGLHAL